jgi:hypothetical protein
LGSRNEQLAHDTESAPDTVPGGSKTSSLACFFILAPYGQNAREKAFAILSGVQQE